MVHSGTFNTGFGFCHGRSSNSPQPTVNYGDKTFSSSNEGNLSSYEQKVKDSIGNHLDDSITYKNVSCFGSQQSTCTLSGLLGLK